MIDVIIPLAIFSGYSAFYIVAMVFLWKIRATISAISVFVCYVCAFLVVGSGPVYVFPKEKWPGWYAPAYEIYQNQAIILLVVVSIGAYRLRKLKGVGP